MTHRRISGFVAFLTFLLYTSALFVCLGASNGVRATPVMYKMFAVTDVSLDGHFYHNAQVYLRFVGDTRDIQTFDVTGPPIDEPPGQPGDEATGFLIKKGDATLLIVSNGRRVSARFLPNQIMVSLDTTNRGGGFGSLIGPNGLEPAYPLAIDNGNLPTDLVTPADYSGNAWSCVGFPPDISDGGNGSCADFPLKTDHGDFIIYHPYLQFDPYDVLDGFDGSINNGIFSIILGK